VAPVDAERRRGSIEVGVGCNGRLEPARGLNSQESWWNMCDEPNRGALACRHPVPRIRAWDVHLPRWHT
jgi:hypothetical protein